MIKSCLKTAATTADILFNAREILRAHDEFMSADEESRQEKHDEMIRKVARAIFPIQGQLFMLGMEVVANGPKYLCESEVVKETVDFARPAIYGLCRFVKSRL